MKKLLILGFAAAFLFSSCEKDRSTSKVSANNNEGVALTDANIPANFNWKTTQQVSIDISGISVDDAKQLIKVEDSRGNLLLTRLMKIEQGDQLHFQLPISEKQLTLTHNGISETVRVFGNKGLLLSKKGGGKSGGGSGSSCYPTNAPCPCEGRMQSVTFQYSGPNGANLTVWYKTQGNNKSQSHSFPNLSTGDIIVVSGNSFTTSGNPNKTPRLKSQTFLSLNGGNNYWNVHTSCSEYILGNIYGPFKVIAFTDGQGSACSDQCIDTDNDGCCDDVDKFPNDPTKCDVQYIPGENVYGSYAFEDLWPSTGDFDFNDMVVDRTTALITDPNGDVIEAQHKFVLKAAGAGYKNGFGFAMPNTPVGEVTSATSSHPQYVPGDYTASTNGLENGQTNAVVIVYENWNQVVTYTTNGKYFNTIRTSNGGGQGYADTITIDVDFAVPQQIADVLEIDPFVIGNGGTIGRGAEIHLPWFKPTDLADATKFNTFKDSSANTNDIPNYITSEMVPWGIETPLSAFEWPLEKELITLAYPWLVDFAQTGSPVNWYDPIYQNPAYIY